MYHGQASGQECGHGRLANDISRTRIDKQAWSYKSDVMAGRVHAT